MKKICIVNFNVYCLFDPSSSAPMGGAELDMYMLAQGLDDVFNTLVITGDWGQKKIEIYDNIKIIRSVKTGNKDIFSVMRNIILIFVTLLKTNADIYISSGAGPEVGIFCFFCKLRAKKYIYRTAHDIDCNGSYIRLNGIKGLSYKYGLEHAHKIITSVVHHKNLLNKYHAHVNEKIHHINLGLQFRSDIDNAGYTELGRDGHILWVARCEDWKNPEAYICLAKSLPQYKFIMICPKQRHNEDYFFSVKRHAKKLSNITFIDFVPFEYIQSYFNNAILFINTSTVEGFTYTLIQSGLAGTPVAYLNVDPDNVIRRHNLGFFANGNMEKLRRSLIDSINNKEIWKRKSYAIGRYVRIHHTMSKLSIQWTSIINSL